MSNPKSKPSPETQRLTPAVPDATETDAQVGTLQEIAGRNATRQEQITTTTLNAVRAELRPMVERAYAAIAGLEKITREYGPQLRSLGEVPWEHLADNVPDHTLDRNRLRQFGRKLQQIRDRLKQLPAQWDQACRRAETLSMLGVQAGSVSEIKSIIGFDLGKTVEETAEETRGLIRWAGQLASALQVLERSGVLSQIAPVDLRHILPRGETETFSVPGPAVPQRTE